MGVFGKGRWECDVKPQPAWTWLRGRVNKEEMFEEVMHTVFICTKNSIVKRDDDGKDYRR